MYAIVDVKDKQFKVREDDTLYVPYHSDADVDERLTLDRVLLLSNEDGDTTLGTPTVDDATVTARVVDHVKGDKVIVFKKKRRKRYRVKRGHRQQYTQIQIESLNADGEAPPPAEPADAESEEAPSDEAEAAPEAEESPSNDATDADAATDEATSDEEPADDAEAADPEPADEVDTADEDSDDNTDSETSEASADADDAAADEAEADEDDEDASDDEDNPFDKDTSF